MFDSFTTLPTLRLFCGWFCPLILRSVPDLPRFAVRYGSVLRVTAVVTPRLRFDWLVWICSYYRSTLRCLRFDSTFTPLQLVTATRLPLVAFYPPRLRTLLHRCTVPVSSLPVRVHWVRHGLPRLFCHTLYRLIRLHTFAFARIRLLTFGLYNVVYLPVGYALYLRLFVYVHCYDRSRFDCPFTFRHVTTPLAFIWFALPVRDTPRYRLPFIRCVRHPVNIRIHVCCSQFGSICYWRITRLFAVSTSTQHVTLRTILRYARFDFALPTRCLPA